MTKLFCAVLCALIYAPALAANTGAAASEPVAIVHYDRLKEAKLDGTATNLKLTTSVSFPGQTPYFQIANELLTPREVKVSIVGVKKAKYDLYVIDVKTRRPFNYPPPDQITKPPTLKVNDYLIGTKTKEELEAGIRIALDGTHLSPAYRDYFTRLRNRCAVGLVRYPTPYDEPGVCNSVMTGITQWTNGAEAADLKMRSATIMIVPSGEPFQPAPGGFIPPPPPLDQTAERICKSVQSARQDIVRLVKNPIIRADGLEVITPMDFALTGKPIPGRKSVFIAILTNWTDRMITGEVAMTVPSGWKASEASKPVKMAGYSKRASVKFEVTPPVTANADAPVSATATLKVDTVRMKLVASTGK